MLQGKECKLAIDNLSNIVAIGQVEATQGLIHSIKLGDSNYRVSVKKSIKGDALLPIPIGDELIQVSHVVGSYVAWPRHLVIFNDFQVKTIILFYVIKFRK